MPLFLAAAANTSVCTVTYSTRCSLLLLSHAALAHCWGLALEVLVVSLLLSYQSAPSGTVATEGSAAWALQGYEVRRHFVACAGQSQSSPSSNNPQRNWALEISVTQSHLTYGVLTANEQLQVG
jgi:hypothetical protein